MTKFESLNICPFVLDFVVQTLKTGINYKTSPSLLVERAGVSPLEFIIPDIEI